MPIHHLSRVSRKSLAREEFCQRLKKRVIVSSWRSHQLSICSTINISSNWKHPCQKLSQQKVQHSAGRIHHMAASFSRCHLNIRSPLRKVSLCEDILVPWGSIVKQDWRENSYHHSKWTAMVEINYKKHATTRKTDHLSMEISRVSDIRNGPEVHPYN